MPDTTTPARRKPPAPRTGWWWLALALTGLMVLVLAITVAVSVSNAMAAEARRANGTTPTTAKSAGQSPAPVQDWGVPGDPNLPLDEEKAVTRVRAFFADLGKAVRDPNGEPDELFTWTEMSEVVPDDAVESQVGQLADSISACRQVVQAEVSVWRQWDWGKVDVRKVMRRPDGAALEAIVWHLTRDGKRVKRRWLLTDSGDGMVALGWEDLHTGVTARDRAYAIAAGSLSPSIRRQRQWQLNQMPEIHRLIDQRKWDEARTRLDRIRTVRFDRELSYTVDMAEARLAFRDRISDDGEWDQELAIEILDDLIARHPERLAAYPVLAEVSLESEEYARAIEVCDAYLSVTGDDPDLLSLRGAAKLALVQTDEAAADFQAALALDKYQPRAVNWQRQRADERGKKAVADVLAPAPDPANLFDALVEWAVPEADWPGVLALAERYRQLRPKEARWVSPLIDALLRLNRT
ncbi:MAG TPA: tetratricopeptide repeat protein, partial [Gemmataceae bacterium]|nr:tetratricopeptide repeat protein [Gemmataceae bacterium]